MIASWMLYCSLCALGLSLAAVLAERALLAARGPVRPVWITAVALSILIPAVALQYAPRERVANAAVAIGPDVAFDSVVAGTAPAPVPVVRQAPPVPLTRNWGAMLVRANRPLVIAWVALSSALALYFFIGIVALAWLRRRWQPRVVQGVPVLVSERTGPALVGAVSPAIVLPEWTLAMAPSQLALMLRHEQEHRRARDGQLLTAAQLAVIIMPWNPALWWQLVRLRLAVELDCDARVLQHTDARSYGDLLLEVARPRREMLLIGAAAFTERAAELERRIRVIARPRGRAARGVRAMAACIGLAVVAIAWVAPRPPAPPRVLPSPTHLAMPVATPTVDPVVPASQALSANDSVPIKQSRTAAAGPSPRDTIARPPTVPAPPRAYTATLLADTVQLAGLTRTDSTPATQGRGGSTPGLPLPLNLRLLLDDSTRSVDAIYHRLFDGIALSAEQALKARVFLTTLSEQQRAQDAAMLGSLTAVFQKRIALLAQRDSALRALPMSDADRATLRERLASSVGAPGLRQGGPGRSGGSDSSFVSPGRAREGGAGAAAGRGGRSGGRGGPPDIPALVDATYHRFFDGLTLTPDQEASARAIIRKAPEEMIAAIPAPATTQVSLRLQTGLVVMQAASDSILISLVTNDGDRATLQSRILVVPSTPVRPPQ